MTATLALRPRDELLAGLKTMSDREFLEGFARLTAAIVDHVWEAAAYVGEAERRGIDLRKFRNTLVPYLRAVWAGTMRPEVICHFIPKEYLIPIVGKLPVAEQVRLSDGAHVPLVVIGPDPTRELYATRETDPLDMTPEQVAQVFDRDCIRTPGQQRAILDAERKVATKPVPERIGPLVIDRERGVYCGKTFIPWKTLEDALKCRKA